MDDQRRKALLIEAVQEAVSHEQQRSRADREAAIRKPASRHKRHLILVGLGWIAVMWIWSVQPSWLFDHPPDPPQTIAEQEATLRFAMYLQAARIREHTRQTGRAPVELTEVGAIRPSIRYTRSGYVWQLEAEIDGRVLQLPSTVDPDKFLGNSIDLLRNQR